MKMKQNAGRGQKQDEKGPSSFGKHRGKVHALCHRCGSKASTSRSQPVANIMASNKKQNKQKTTNHRKGSEDVVMHPDGKWSRLPPQHLYQHLPCAIRLSACLQVCHNEVKELPHSRSEGRNPKLKCCYFFNSRSQKLSLLQLAAIFDLPWLVDTVLKLPPSFPHHFSVRLCVQVSLLP